MAQLTVYVNQKPLVLTDDEETYYSPPAVHYKSYIYCKAKSNEDALKVINICEKDEKLEIAMLFNASMDTLKEMVWSHFTEVIAAGGVVVNEKNEVLLIQRKNKWDLPKGKADKGETNEQTALREVKEETGLQNISITKSLETTYHTYMQDEEKILKVSYWFEMKGDSTERLTPQTDEQITQAKWIERLDLNNYMDATYLSLIAVLKDYLQ